jgi:hypothetical protein
MSIFSKELGIDFGVILPEKPLKISLKGSFR